MNYLSKSSIQIFSLVLFLLPQIQAQEAPDKNKPTIAEQEKAKHIEESIDVFKTIPDTLKIKQINKKFLSEFYPKNSNSRAMGEYAEISLFERIRKQNKEDIRLGLETIAAVDNPDEVFKDVLNADQINLVREFGSSLRALLKSGVSMESIQTNLFNSAAKETKSVEQESADVIEYSALIVGMEERRARKDLAKTATKISTPLVNSVRESGVGKLLSPKKKGADYSSAPSKNLLEEEKPRF